MKLNVDFDDLYKAAEEMGAKPVEIDLKLCDGKISTDRITVDFERKNWINVAAQEKQTQKKST
ncbi:MAG: hypothetical protein Q8K07_16110 [Methylicorpusculum sp.]|jgi:hypothetical protein|uniref:hypothetical protein n=1 Tax=Methylicorpusculum TaxID=2713642 RepID=UPI00135A0EAF|nr:MULTISPECIES: hypothetical protein [Methylicorpusculum]MBS3951900.1 hypothetical protein [Methylomicrobium sp.]MCD2451988.1 hypothetical protein [Methylicorpusculum oleiharenae]MDP2203548.1 hypothetical protein [Methylicorpusculum sp.]